MCPLQDTCSVHALFLLRFSFCRPLHISFLMTSWNWIGDNAWTEQTLFALAQELTEAENLAAFHCILFSLFISVAFKLILFSDLRNGAREEWVGRQGPQVGGMPVQWPGNSARDTNTGEEAMDSSVVPLQPLSNHTCCLVPRTPSSPHKNLGMKR